MNITKEMLEETKARRDNEAKLFLENAAKIRPFLNFHGYSDIEPYEVIRTISPKCVEIRKMKSTESDWDKTFIPGGFCGTFINQHSQKWIIESDTTQPIIRARFGKKGWKSARGYHCSSDTARKFYDFNF